MKFGSLFSGIGGIDLGLERAGMTCIWQSEIEPYACQVLKKHWPDIPNLGDIRDIDWTTVERADVVAGGYPCQPFSQAGRRAGEDDPRHLWPMFAECIRVVRPRFALLENVAGHLSLGFGSVLSDLAALGYDARWDCIPAAAVGAPHLRDRVFVIATRRAPMDTDSERQPRQPMHGSTCTWPSPMAHAYDPRSRDGRSESDGRAEPRSGRATLENTDGQRLAQRESPTITNQPKFGRRSIDAGWRTWELEPNVGRVANGIPHRLDRLRALGNAVVPQVAEHIGRIIMEANNDR